jgi:D-ribose pyranase
MNRHISHLVASLGHLDEIVIGDAGLPVPKDVAVIDLAVSAGIPSFWDVLAAVQSELVIETGVFASDCSPELGGRLGEALANWNGNGHTPVVSAPIPHADFKTRTSHAKAILRTGECIPYCNIILVSGVPF